MSQRILAKSVGETSTNKNKFSMFVGRWQPWHSGHRWLIDQRLNEGKNVLVCIRDVEVSPNNPWTAEEIEKNLRIELDSLIQEGRIKILIIPDIESINIGRGIGYDVIEHVPPPEINNISATKIREKIFNSEK